MLDGEGKGVSINYILVDIFISLRLLTMDVTDIWDWRGRDGGDIKMVPSSSQRPGEIITKVSLIEYGDRAEGGNGSNERF